MEQEKRLRREIANSNERRRMQSINAGFQSLRGLLPHHEGEKLSKAAILQQTAEYIFQLEQERTKLLNQTTQLKQIITSQNGVAGELVVGGNTGSTAGSHNGVYSSPQSPASEIPPPIAKRRKTIDGAVESADEGIGSMSPDHSGSGEESRSELTELRRETMELRLELERERRHHVSMEEHIGMLQRQLQSSHQQHEAEVYSQQEPRPEPRNPARRYTSDGKPSTGLQVVLEADAYTKITNYIRHFDEPPRGNLETIVEAIRHLEGDLFIDGNYKCKPAAPSPCMSSPRAMEVCSPPQISPNRAEPQSMMEVAPSCADSFMHTVNGSGSPYEGMNVPVSTTVTSLKHHVLNRLARCPEQEEQPINLQFRPVVSRSSSPFLQQQQQTIPNHFHLQQQLRPGVIVVKHS